MGFSVVRDAPGSPSEFFGSLMSNFTCGPAVTDTITYCSNLTFDLNSISHYDDSCVVGIDGCRNLSCEYGSLSRANYESICAQNDCQYGLLNYFQVQLYTYTCIICTGT